MAASEYTLRLPRNNESTFLGVSFSNGTLNKDQYDGVKVSVYKQKKPGGRTAGMRKLVVQTESMDYVGNFDSTKREPGCDYYIGVGDETTGEMNLVLFKRVRARPAISCPDEDSDDGDQPVAATTLSEKRDRLTEAFGGAKQKKNMDARLKHGIDKDMVHSALEVAGLESMVDLTTPEQAEESCGLLPPHNENATTPEEAYPLHQFFPEALQTDLANFVADMMDYESRDEFNAEEPQYSGYVLKHLPNLPLKKSEREKILICLKFLHLLMTVYKMRSKILKKDIFETDIPDPTLSMPDTCRAYILKEFTVVDNRVRRIPSRLRDKLLVVIILLALRVENYDLNATQLIKDLELPSSKLVPTVRAMGCRIKADKSSAEHAVVIQLQTPLVFPTQSKFKKRKTQ